MAVDLFSKVSEDRTELFLCCFLPYSHCVLSLRCYWSVLRYTGLKGWRGWG